MDPRERSLQVAMMADIYSRSRRNLVNLGEAEATTGLAIQSINLIMSDIKKRTRNFQDTQNTPFNGLREWFFNDVKCGADEPALISFYSSNWFRRVWAFQEAALAPSNVCVLGRLRLDLEEVLRVAKWIYCHTPSYTYALRNNLGLRCAEELFDFADKVYGEYRTAGVDPPTLIKMLNISTRLLASDSKDHLYGLLGLWCSMNSQTLLPVTLTPDYEKPIAHVFRDATRAALMERNDLLAWCLISHRCQESIFSSEIPSWVLMADRPFDQEQDAEHFYYPFNANNNLQRPIDDPTDEDGIVMYGIHIGRVLDVTDVLQYQDVKNYEGIKGWTHNVVMQVQQKTNNKAIYNDIAKVLLAGKNVNRNPATLEDVRDFFHFLEYMDDRQTWRTQSTQDQWNAVNRFWTNMHSCLNRRVFITDTQSLGLGPKLTRAGDIVVILYNGRVPFVLRPDGEQYRLVGGCYVDGVMYGEAMEKHKEQGSPDVEFRIR